MHAELHSHPLWVTPTLTLQLKDCERLNERLTSIILNEERKFAGKEGATPVAGLEGGLTANWLNYNVLNWAYTEISEFREYVITGIDEFFNLLGDPIEPGMTVSGISCWANVLRPGQGLQVHHHDPAFLSAHYTVRTGHEGDPGDESGDSGHTIYFRPGFLDRSHGGKSSMMPSPWDQDWRISVRATAGKLFFFPSYVRHEVRPYLGKTYRISIAMDIFIKSQEYPIYFGGPRWYVPKVPRQAFKR